MRLLPAAYQLDEAIRPRQCPMLWGGVHWKMEGDDRIVCGRCGGLGFLYPDPPDPYWWNPSHLLIAWGTDEPTGMIWQRVCDTVWRVLRVVEDTDG